MKNFYTATFFYLVFCSAILAQSGIQYPKSDTTSVHKDYPYVLPIWGQALTDRNIDFQLPFGLNVNYIYNEMDIAITDFSMYVGNDPTTPANEIISSLINHETLNFSQTTAKAQGINIRADAWILPFLNIYGIFAENDGYTGVVLQPTWRDESGDIILQLPVFESEVTFESKTYGIGTTFVYGWNDYFISADANFTSSKSELLTQRVGIVVASARIGRRVIFPNNMKLAVYFGAMYRNFLSNEGNDGTIKLNDALPGLEEHILGGIEERVITNNNEITRLREEKPPGWVEDISRLTAKNTALGLMYENLDGNEVFSTNINYFIKKELVSNWTTQIGFNFEISPNWMIRGEYGYSAHQKFLMTGLQYRFGL